MPETIAQHRPVLLAEVTEESARELARRLRGYSGFRVGRRLEPGALYRLADERLVFLLVGAVPILAEIALADADIVAENVRQTVAPGVIDKRPAVGVDVLEGDPGRGEIPQRIRCHVNGIGVDGLLGPLMGRDRLKGLRLAVRQQP